MTCAQKACLPVWCWRSFIHDKHEAFRFKYSTKQLNELDSEIGWIIKFMYSNSILYYFIMIVCPIIFRGECGPGLDITSHIIYAVYCIVAIIFEVTIVLWIKNHLKNDNLLKLNKWHIVELIFGQVARLDTYLDVCFWMMLVQCGEWQLAIPVGILIILYLTYPIFSIIKMFFWKNDDQEF